MPSGWQSSKAVLADWRFWAIAIGATLACGLIAGMLGLNHGVGAAGGVVCGLLLQQRRLKLRMCPACGATIDPSSVGG
jgi:hypothetical protein